MLNHNHFNDRLTQKGITLSNFRRYRFFIMSTFLVFGVFVNAYANKTTSLNVFVDSSYPPYMYKVKGLEAGGLYPKILKEIANKTGHKFNIQAYPWARALSQGALGKGAIAGAYKNDERLNIYDFSNPIYQEKLVLFVNKNNQFDFEGISDLKGKVIGVNRGWSYGQAFDAAREEGIFNVNVRNNPKENFKMLALGRIDSLILDQLSGESYLQLMGLEDKIVMLPKPFSINNAYLILNKKLNKRIFLNEFNTALEQLRSNGRYKHIVQSFIKEAF